MMHRRTLALCLALTPLLTGSLRAADPNAVEAPRGMVVAAEPLATRAGVEMLQAGGNAVDAAVAVGFALAVTYPAAGNLGGGGFLVAHLHDDGTSTRVALDFRERAPAAAHSRLYVEARQKGRQNASTLGHLAAGVPGSVAGMLHALENWGTLDRSTVMAPAIRLAEQGFALPRRTARFLANPTITKRMKQFDATRAIFYPDDRPIAEGEVLRQPDLAQTLRRIAREGSKGFYAGPVAEAIAPEMERGEGLISRQDLAEYRPVERTPIVIEFRGRTILSMPPPSSGGVCLKQMLTMLDGFPLAELGHNSAASLHLLAESMRRSYADRNRFLGDPDHAKLPLKRLLSRRHLQTLARGIDPKAASPSERFMKVKERAPREREQTTHYSVIDRHGNAVAVTTTLNGAFGSKVVVPGTGFLLNNEMDDFTSEPGKPNLYGLVQGAANAVGPGKRPLSSMTPTVVLDSDGHVEYVLGTPGGSTIITNVLQVLLNLIVYELEPQAAVNAPKIHHQCIPDRIFFEKELSPDTRAALEALGHEVKQRSWIGDLQLIAVDRERGVLLGACDPRGGGAAMGY